MAKGFICYAHADRTMFQEVRKQLAALETAFPITFWDDPSLRGGDSWDEVIKAEVAAADLFLLLFSPDWFSSTYIQQTELPAILVIAHPTPAIGSAGSLTASTKRMVSNTEARLAFAVLTTERKAA